ncbi:MAG: thiamine phosphate synthase [Burkholderiaceae bacterium]|nr:thiamine phosphate synthase [Burkholderiaceae bacterium]
MIPLKPDSTRLAGVYLLTPDADSTGFARVMDIVAQALDAGVRVIQYREKTAQFTVQFERTRRLLELTRQAGALLIANDSVDLAAKSNADGVHIGRADGDVAGARRLLIRHLIGVSCYDDLDCAQRAVSDGADAVAFGSMFVSATKPSAVRAPLSLLSKARSLWPQERVIAIGGINTSNIGTVAKSGAHAAAVLDSVFGADNPAEAARELVRRFEEGKQQYDEQRRTV